MMVTMQITTVYSTNQSFMWYVFLVKLCGILGNVQMLSILFKIIPCSTQISFHSLAHFPLTYTIKESELIFFIRKYVQKVTEYDTVHSLSIRSQMKYYNQSVISYYSSKSEHSSCLIPVDYISRSFTYSSQIPLTQQVTWFRFHRKLLYLASACCILAVHVILNTEFWSQ